jgi:uncharacterized protein with beta-barrel porin domain
MSQTGAWADTTISSSTTTPLQLSSGNLTITSAGSITYSVGDTVYTSAAFGTINNAGRLDAGLHAIHLGSSTDAVLNSGTIIGASIGIYNVGGTLGLLDNTGSITATGVSTPSAIRLGLVSGVGTVASYAGVYNIGTITTLNNEGTITGAYGINNTGTISSFTNSGTIAGSSYALYNGSSATLATINNSGSLQGNITNLSSTDLTINGGADRYGTLTGSGGAIGVISNTNSNVAFGVGNLLLNDNINVGSSHKVASNGATLQLQNSVAITGNYLQTGGGLVIATTSGGTSYGSLSVSGNATVTGSAITISGSGLRAGETFTIVDANSTSTYSNDTASVSGTSGLTASVGTVAGADFTDLVVTLIGPRYTMIGNAAGGAAAGIGPALDAIAASNTPAALAFQRDVLTPLAALPTWQQPSAMRQLAPLQIAPAIQVANLAITPTTTAIETHQLVLGDSTAAGVAAGSAPYPYGLWGQVLGGVAQRNSDAATDGYRSSNFGLVSGLDFHVDADTTVGAALSWSRGWSWGEQAETGSFATVDSYQLTAYGQHYWGQVFLDGQVGVGYDSFNQRRSIGSLGNMARATYDGQHYLAKLGGGYDFAMSGGVTLTPLAGLQILRAVSGGYTETGANENLTINRHGVESLTQDIGGKIAWKAASDWGMLTPELRLAWVHDYVQGAIVTTGTMVGNTPYASGTARPASDGARVNVAATLETTDNMNLRAEYEGEGRQNYQSHTGMLKASWNF